jgi:hypothetical protein
VGRIIEDFDRHLVQALVGCFENSDVSESGEKELAKAFLAQSGVIHASFLLQHLVFDGSQKIFSRLIYQFGFTLLSGYAGVSHFAII